jgi:hypothetical protein
VRAAASGDVGIDLPDGPVERELIPQIGERIYVGRPRRLLQLVTPDRFRRGHLQPT